jgi:hypothetical protein
VVLSVELLILVYLLCDLLVARKCVRVERGVLDGFVDARLMSDISGLSDTNKRLLEKISRLFNQAHADANSIINPKPVIRYCPKSLKPIAHHPTPHRTRDLASPSSPAQAEAFQLSLESLMI